MRDKKDLRFMLKEAGILFAITLIAGIALGFVYELTKDPIKVQEELKISRACQAVFGQASVFNSVEFAVSPQLEEQFLTDGVGVDTVYEAQDGGGALLGYVLAVHTSEGYGGNISIYMGVRSDGTLNGISILKIAETPGLGMEAGNVLVPQFEDKKVTSFTYTKTGASADNQIDAISGATITTRAVTNAVNAGLSFFAEQLQEGGESHE